MKRYALRKDVVYRRESDGALIYNHATGRVTPLNAIAAFMCESLFIDALEPEEILNGIKARWNVADEDRVRTDLEKFIIGMEKLELIQEMES